MCAGVPTIWSKRVSVASRASAEAMRARPKSVTTTLMSS